MSRLLLFVTCLFFWGGAFSQTDLHYASRSSDYKYIYRITNDMVRVIHENKYSWLSITDPGLAIDSIDNDHDISWDKYSYGNYLLLYVTNLEIRYEVHVISPAIVKTQPGFGFNSIAVYDKKGEVNKDAEVWVNKKKIAYDEQLRVFRLPMLGKKDVVAVTTSNTIQLFEKGYRYHYRGGFFRQPHRYILRYLFLPVRLFMPRSNSGYAGYMVTNKPKYQPGDTVKVKAYYVNRKGKPCTRPLKFEIRNRQWKVIWSHVQSPDKNNSYTFEFVLNDSFQLDQQYGISAVKKRGKGYFPNNSFYYEDYLLDETAYRAEVSKEMNTEEDSISFAVEAYDASGLPMQNGSAEVIITPGYIDTWHGNSVYIPDTFYRVKVPIDPEHQTNITLPAHIWPEAKLNLVAHIIFNNSNNQRHDTVIHFSNDFKNPAVKFKDKDGLLTASANRAMKGTLYFYSMMEQIVDSMSITLPAEVRIPATASSVRFISGTQWYHHRFTERNGKVNVSLQRTTDSVFLSITNPLHLLIGYEFFKESQLISRDVCYELDTTFADHSKNGYRISYHYLWNDLMVEENVQAVIYDKNLQIRIEAPPVIGPGKSIAHKVTVTDYLGAPVKDVNLTVASVSSQFKTANIPAVPYLGKTHVKGKYHRLDQLRHGETAGYNFVNRKLVTRFGLDSSDYYHFVFAKEGIVCRYDSVGVTEFAPHVFCNGKAWKIYFIYVDNRMVYTRFSNANEHYSFPVSPGYHRISIRLRKELITIDSVLVKEGHKLELAFNKCYDHKKNDHVTVSKRKAEITDSELEELRNNMLLINGYSNNDIFIFNKQSAYRVRGNYEVRVGPLKPYEKYTIYVPGEFEKEFVFEPGYSYYFLKNETKQKTSVLKAFQFRLNSTMDDQLKLGELALTPEQIHRYQVAHQSPFVHLPRNYFNGFAYLEFKHLNAGSLLGIKLCKADLPEGCMFLHKDIRMFTSITPGTCVVTSYYENGRFRVDSIEVHETGFHGLKIDGTQTQPADLNSSDWRYILNETRTDTFADGYFRTGRAELRGTITDEKNGRIDYEMVSLKYGGHIVDQVLTDEDGMYIFRHIRSGNYTIEVPGYSIPGVIKVTLTDDAITVRNLTIRSLSGSGRVRDFDHFSSLQVRKAKPQALLDVSVSSELKFKGSRADGVAYYIDGVRVTSGNVTVPQNAIDAELANLPGLRSSRMASADSLLSMLQGTDPAASEGRLRSNFSDFAIWQPSLITDQKGEATFDATYPDNITTWNTHVLAMDAKKHSGKGFTQTVAVKPITARLNLPRFLIVGDTFHVFGTTNNYSGKPANASHRFSLNGQVIGETDSLLDKFYQGSSRMVASVEDTLEIAYQTELGNGYMDGEEKKVTVLPQGFEYTDGFFHVLNQDTSFTFTPGELSNATTIYMQRNSIDVIRDEIRLVKKYPYDCNEQLASKLIAYVAEKMACDFLKQPFRYNGEVRRIIRKLEANINSKGLWGWWLQSEESVGWISSHVIGALKFAAENGFEVKPRKYLKDIEQLTAGLDPEQTIDLLYRICQAREQANFIQYFDELEKKQLSFYSRVQLIWVMKSQDTTLNIDWLVGRQKRTWSGAVYWGDDAGSTITHNNRMLTVMAFGIIKRDAKYRYLLPLIAQYFMENRTDRGWYNTYESASILREIVPFLIAQGTDGGQAKVTLTQGAAVHTAETFPYGLTLKGNAPATVNKSGGGFIYFTAYQQYHVTNPKEKTGDYTVRTSFNNSNSGQLTAGAQVPLEAEVTLKQKSDYVMIEIPIPAGCVYGDNLSVRNGHEIHREYHKEKLVIFCTTIPAGTYKFTVNLQARYPGRYTINPAKVCLMYFPTFNGNNTIGNVSIR